MDVLLSGADDRNICKELKSKQETAYIPIILFSAVHNFRGNLGDCKPDAIVTKPFSAPELVNIINEHVN